MTHPTTRRTARSAWGAGALAALTALTCMPPAAFAVDEPNLNNNVAAPGVRLPHTVQTQRPRPPGYRPEHRPPGDGNPGYAPRPGYAHGPGYGPGPGRYPPGYRGAGPDHAFYRGGRLPPMYRDRAYVVDDWRAHRLSRPPRGYYWVQTGGDYVLAAIATGVILQVVLAP